MKPKPILILLLLLLQLTAKAQQTYQLDIKKSKLFWKSPKTMGKGHFGYLLFSFGNLNYSPAGQPVSGFFSIDMNTLNSTDRKTAKDKKEVDDLLKNKDFLAVDQFPTTVMNVKQIIRTNQPNVFKVKGDLTIRGITNPIEFLATIKKSGNAIRVTGEIKVDRIKWNIHHQPKTWDPIAALKDKVIADEFPVTLDLYF